MSVPAEYQALYGELDATLAGFDATLPPGGAGRPTFAAELGAANSHVGLPLLDPARLPALRTTLDRMQAMGLRGVRLFIGHNLLVPDFPNSAGYLAFYRQLVAEIRQRGLTSLVQVHAMFPNFTPLPISYAGLTWDAFLAARRETARLIGDQVLPDYLSISVEPTTEAAIIGLPVLATPAGNQALVSAILAGLRPGVSRIGAGIGTWEDVAFVRDYLLLDPRIDYIDLHVYPVGFDFLPKLLTLCDLARQDGREVCIGECWLQKESEAELQARLDLWTIYGRDPYSFWAPLDERFLALMARVARLKGVSFLSPFWSNYLWAYLEYGPATVALTPQQRRAQADQAAWATIQAGALSPTGEAYKRLAAAGVLWPLVAVVAVLAGALALGAIFGRR